MTPQTVARQGPVSMGFSRQENWSRLPCPPPGDLPNPGIETASSLAGEFFTTSATWEAQAVGIGTIKKNTNESNDDDMKKPILIELLLCTGHCTQKCMFVYYLI